MFYKAAGLPRPAALHTRTCPDLPSADPTAGPSVLSTDDHSPSAVSFSSEGNNLVRSFMIRTRTIVTVKIPSIPSPITFNDCRNTIPCSFLSAAPLSSVPGHNQNTEDSQLSFSISFTCAEKTLSYSFGTSPRMRPPAMTEAIWPETLTPVACMIRMLVGSSFKAI